MTYPGLFAKGKGDVSGLQCLTCTHIALIVIVPLHTALGKRIGVSIMRLQGESETNSNIDRPLPMT